MLWVIIQYSVIYLVTQNVLALATESSFRLAVSLNRLFLIVFLALSYCASLPSGAITCFGSSCLLPAPDLELAICPRSPAFLCCGRV